MVIGQVDVSPAKFTLSWLNIWPFNIVKQIQVLESQDFNLVSSALCLFQLLFS